MTRPMVMGAILLILSGCTRSPHLASGPIDVGTSPIFVRFEQPMSARECELCLEFDPPGGSLSAGGIRVVLLDASGQRFAFVRSSLDRRGESTICLIGHIEVTDPPPSGFVAAELVAERPVRVRAIRGGPRE